MKQKKKIIYDIESLPNFFCIVFSELEGNKTITYEISSRVNQRKEILKVCKSYWLIGYNNLHYDDILLNYIHRTPNCTAKTINKVSQGIINSTKYLYYPYKKGSFTTSDVLPLLASSKLRVSLKHLQIITKWHNVQEFEIDWTKDLPESEWDNCIDYCINDVLSLKHVCKTLKKDFELRDYVFKTTGQNGYSKDPVKIAEYAMCDAIAKGLGKNTEAFISETKENNKKRSKIVIGDLLNSFIEFKTKRFQKVHQIYKDLVLIPEEEDKKKDDDKFGHLVKFNNMWIVFGLGGLHHSIGLKTGKKKLKPRGQIHKEIPGTQLLMPDVGSYYPSQRIKLGYEHRFDPYLLEEYTIAYEDKASAKKEGNKLLEGYSKLRLNSVYGLYNSVHSPLYQPEVSYATAINGQLMLAMLIEELDLNGIKVLGTNTDSVTVRVKDEQWDIYQKVCKEWEQLTKMTLDHDKFTAIYEQSCNNYIAVMPNGYVKTKGDLVPDLNLLKGYKYPIVKNAVINYFVSGTPIEKTIKNHKDIYDFCMTTKMGVDNSTGERFEAYHNDVKLQRTNRYYASTNGAYLYKKSSSKVSHVLKDSGVTILNKFEEKDDYKINYPFYLDKARSMVRSIETKQLSLF